MLAAAADCCVQFLLHCLHNCSWPGGLSAYAAQRTEAVVHERVFGEALGEVALAAAPCPSGKVQSRRSRRGSSQVEQPKRRGAGYKV